MGLTAEGRCAERVRCMILHDNTMTVAKLTCVRPLAAFACACRSFHDDVSASSFAEMGRSRGRSRWVLFPARTAAPLPPLSVWAGRTAARTALLERFLRAFVSTARGSSGRRVSTVGSSRRMLSGIDCRCGRECGCDCDRREDDCPCTLSFDSPVTFLICCRRAPS